MKNTDSGTSQVVLVIKKTKTKTKKTCLPIQETEETQVQFLDQADSWEKGMASNPVFLPGESHGWRTLAGYSSWGHRESDTTEAT